jgi:hypothetical protein
MLRGPAAGAEVIETGRTGPETAVADVPIAVVAAADTVAAEPVAALFAAPLLIAADRHTAGLTGDAVPVLQSDIRTVGVVSPEGLLHDQEVLAQPPVLKRPFQGLSGSSLAETFIQHMGMGDVGPVLGITGLQGHDPQFVPVLHGRPVPDQFERTEIEVLQFNPGGGDANPSVPQVELYLGELLG